MITIPEQYIKYLNLIILIYYYYFIKRGYNKGFLPQLIALAGSALSLFCAWRYCDVLSSFFHVVPTSMLPLQDTLLADMIETYANSVVWFLIIFLAVRVVFGLCSNLFGGARKVPGVKQAGGLLGGVLGGLLATVYVIVAGVVLNTSLFSNGSVAVKQSMIGTISDTVSTTLAKQGLPINMTDAVNEIYLGAQNLSDTDKVAVEEWLLDHGYRKAED